MCRAASHWPITAHTSYCQDVHTLERGFQWAPHRHTFHTCEEVAEPGEGREAESRGLCVQGGQ